MDEDLGRQSVACDVCVGVCVLVYCIGIIFQLQHEVTIISWRPTVNDWEERES